MRKVSFIEKEFYHIFNRGVDKRNIFLSKEDISRFLESMEEFNCIEPVGSILEQRVSRKLGRPTSNESGEKLVNIICYCLNPNHFHFILEQCADNGISEFMKRLSGGYAKYFNEKYKREGALFQGRFKSVHIDSNEYLLYVSSYVNLNYIVHGIKKDQIFTSSWEEYVGKIKKSICKSDIILGQFKTKQEYGHIARETAAQIGKKRYEEKMGRFFLE